MELLSEFYQDQIILNDKITYKYTWVNLFYFRPYEWDRGTGSRHVPTSTPLTFRIGDKEVTQEELLEKYGIQLLIDQSQITDQYGRASHTPTFRLVISQEDYEKHKDKMLYVSSFLETLAHSPQKGYVRYHFTYARPSKSGWVAIPTPQDANISMSISTQRLESARACLLLRLRRLSKDVGASAQVSQPNYWLSHYYNRYDADSYKDDLSNYFKIDDIGRYDDSGTLYYDFTWTFNRL